MKTLRNALALGLFICFSMTACMQDQGVGGTIAAQVAGTFMSTNATVIVDNNVVVDTMVNYELTIKEVDANTISVISEHAGAFEVDLEKNDNGDLTTGSTNSAASGFTFIYHVPEASLTMKYSRDNTIINFEGVKQ